MDSNHRRHKPADLQSAPFGHSGNFPYVLPPLLARPSVVVSRWRDSNPRPPDYKSSALPTELHRHFNRSECTSRYKKCIGKIFCDNFSKIFRQRTAIRTAASRTTEAKSGAKIIQSGELTNFSAEKTHSMLQIGSPKGLRQPAATAVGGGRTKRKVGESPSQMDSPTTKPRASLFTLLYQLKLRPDGIMAANFLHGVDQHAIRTSGGRRSSSERSRG